MKHTQDCVIAYCGQTHKGLGLCNKHLLRLRRTGTTDEWKQSLADRFWSKVDRREVDECWLWTAATNEHGYGVMRPEGKRSGATVKAHRVSLELAGVEVEGRVVRHSCDNPPCVNPAHLSVGSPADNAADRNERNRTARGSRSGTHKLTEDQVREVRRRVAGGDLHRNVAADHGVSRSTVTRIANGGGWAHV